MRAIPRQRQRGTAFDRKPGQVPALDKQEFANIIAFLKTLDVGYAVTGQTGKLKLAGR